MGNEKTCTRKLLKKTRSFCLECMSGNKEEIVYCSDCGCELYLFRFGRIPAGKDWYFIPESGEYEKLWKIVGWQAIWEMKRWYKWLGCSSGKLIRLLKKDKKQMKIIDDIDDDIDSDE